MSVKIKNCGLKTEEDIRAAAHTGASYVGFVHHIASPRHLSFEQIAELSELTPSHLQQVVVMVNPSDDVIAELQRHVRPNLLQLHEVQDPKRIRDITARTAIPIIAAISVRSAADIEHVAALEVVSAHVLLDGAQPGSGRRFDWALLKGLSLKKPWFLSGGLDVENVAEAISRTGAPMVDVSSGIESRLGVKDPEMIAAFNRAVLNAAHG